MRLSVKQQRGSASALALMVMTVMMIVGTSYMMVSNSEVRASANGRSGVAAQHLAESGALLALNRLDKDSSFRTSTNSTAGVAQNSAETKNSGTSTAGTFIVTTNNATGDAAMRKIVSIATVAGATKTVVVTARVNQTALSNYSVFSGGRLFFNETGVVVDSAANNPGNSFDRVGSNASLEWRAPGEFLEWLRGKESYGTGGVDATGAISTNWESRWWLFDWHTTQHPVYGNEAKTESITTRNMSSPAVTYTPNQAEYSNAATSTTMPDLVGPEPSFWNLKPRRTMTLPHGSVVYVNGDLTIPSNTTVVVATQPNGSPGKATIYTTGNLKIGDGARIGTSSAIGDPRDVSTARTDGEILMVSDKNVLIDSDFSLQENSFANTMVFANGNLDFTDNSTFNGNCAAHNSLFIANGAVSSKKGKLLLSNDGTGANINSLINTFQGFNPSSNGKGLVVGTFNDIDL